jgi:hypothetical protein
VRGVQLDAVEAGRLGAAAAARNSSTICGISSVRERPGLLVVDQARRR